METVVCPHCGKKVELTAALRADLEEKITQELKVSQEAEIFKLKREIEETTEKKFREEKSLREMDLLNQIEELNKVKKLTDQKELELLKKEREMDDRNRKLEVELQRKLNEQVSLVRKEEDQKAKLEKMEVEKKLADTQKALDELQQKTKQGSQQLQGEVLELDLEKQLTANFPNDEILPVPKGVNGGDIWQKVRNSRSQVAGSILWETKRTRSWSGAWLPKLREDCRVAGASEPILVSEILPESVVHFGRVDGVWVTTYQYAIPVASLLRVSLMHLAAAKSAATNKDEKLEELYQYLISDSFRHRFEAQVESAVELQNDLDSEKRSTLRGWKRREIQIKRLIGNTSSMYGELQGIVGDALPTIKSLDGPSGEEIEEEKKEQEELNLLS